VFVCLRRLLAVEQARLGGLWCRRSFCRPTHFALIVQNAG
jgi:hypothetical protein